MENLIRQAEAEWLECFEIFSQTGNCQDARLMIDAYEKYNNLLLAQEDAREI